MKPGRKRKPPRSPRLGDLLYEERRRLGMTQEEFAKKVGLTKYSISKYENGITIPAGYVLVKMARVFGMSAGDFARRIYTVIEEEWER